MLTARLAELARRPLVELERLPDWSDAGRTTDGIELTLNRKLLSDGRLEIVLQAYRPGRHILFVKFGRMAAKGFWATPDGTVVSMPPDALYDYT
jgi:hypothetical protein